jgi:hypothetical protein
VAGLALLLDWVTVTVTVVLDWDLVLVLLVLVALVPRAVDVFDDLVEVLLTVLGGATVTVLELVVLHCGSFTLLLPQRRLCGLELAAVVVSVPAEVSVPLPASELVVDGAESEQAWVPMMWQRDRPMPVVVEVSAGTATAAS